MLDALRVDYVTPDKMPFLCAMTTRASATVRHITPPIGFEPDDAYFAGAPLESGDYFAEFVFCPERSPFGFVPSTIGAIIDRLPWSVNLAARVVVDYAARLLAKDPRLRDRCWPARVPLKHIAQFDMNCHHYPWSSSTETKDTVFNRVEAQGGKYFVHAFPQHNVNSGAAAERVERCVGGHERLIYVHIGDLDRAGHRWGPESKEVLATAQLVDKAVQKIVAVVRSRVDDGDLFFLVFGDHGMVPVEHIVDTRGIEEKLRSLGEGMPPMFIDSVFVRLWLSGHRHCKRVVRVLEELDRVSILKSQAGKGPIDDRFGTIIAMSLPGAIFHPSYYSCREPPRGMHGYGALAAGNRTLGIGWGAVDSGERVERAREGNEGKDVGLEWIYETVMKWLDVEDNCARGRACT